MVPLLAAFVFSVTFLLPLSSCQFSDQAVFWSLHGLISAPVSTTGKQKLDFHWEQFKAKNIFPVPINCWDSWKNMAVFRPPQAPSQKLYEALHNLWIETDERIHGRCVDLQKCKVTSTEKIFCRVKNQCKCMNRWTELYILQKRNITNLNKIPAVHKPYIHMWADWCSGLSLSLSSVRACCCVKRMTADRSLKWYKYCIFGFFVL